MWGRIQWSCVCIRKWQHWNAWHHVHSVFECNVSMGTKVYISGLRGMFQRGKWVGKETESLLQLLTFHLKSNQIRWNGRQYSVRYWAQSYYRNNSDLWEKRQWRKGESLATQLKKDWGGSGTVGNWINWCMCSLLFCCVFHWEMAIIIRLKCLECFKFHHELNC